MDGAQEETQDVRSWVLQRREVAQALRHEAERMRTRIQTQREVLERRRAALTDPARLRRRLAAAERRAGNLEAALGSNRRIGMAIGVLMARHGLTDEQAFDVLRRYSNQHNVKLASVAESVLYTGQLAGTGQPSWSTPSAASRARTAAARARAVPAS